MVKTAFLRDKRSSNQIEE
ncbi:hypothetical protein Gotur_016247 [Gossypium turneri]